MLKNFLLVSYRNLRQNKGASFLNILSLSLGMAACLFIFQYLYFEYTFDIFSNSSHVYRVETDTYGFNSLQKKDALTAPFIGPELKETFDEIENITRLMPFSDNGTAFFSQTQADGSSHPLYVEKVYFAENSLLEIFSVELIEGDTEEALSTPNTILVSESGAQKLFREDLEKDISILGKTLKTGREGIDENVYIITGIFKDFPIKSHLQANMLVSLSSPESGLSFSSGTQNQSLYTYLVEKPNSSLQSIQSKASNHIYLPLITDTLESRLSFLPIQEIHLNSTSSNEPSPRANIVFLTFLGLVGLIILILSCTNYVNSAIINSIDRAKEVGVRKLLGIAPRQLMLSFLGEAFMINLLAGVLAFFNFIMGLRLMKLYTKVDYPVPMEWETLKTGLAFVLVLVIVSTILSGIYPATFLSTLKPIEALRGKAQVLNSKLSSKGSKVIRFLLVFQIAMGISFLSAVYIVHQQLEFLKSHDSQSIELKVTAKFSGAGGTNQAYIDKFNRFIQAQSNDRIKDVILTNLYNGQIKKTQSIKPFYLVDTKQDTTKANYQLYVIDHQYWKDSAQIFLAGRNFKPQFSADFDKVIINESAMQALGFTEPDSLLGKQVGQYNGYLNVSGVIKNKSALEGPKAYVTGINHPTFFQMTVKSEGSSSEKIMATLNNLEYTWASQFPNFYFLDRQYNDQLAMEQNILKLFFFFSLIAILIASLGMFGLSSFTAYKRTKEIGIRKVLGAHAGQILVLLLYDFLVLIFYASILTLPVVIYGAREWLANYAVRINLSPTLVLFPILMMLMICIVIIVKQCWKTAVSNPVNSLEMN